MKNAVKKKKYSTHLLFVCEEKAKVSLAKSSLFSNLSSFEWVQKLSSERSSAPNWTKGKNSMDRGTKDVNGDNVKKKVYKMSKVLQH